MVNDKGLGPERKLGAERAVLGADKAGVKQFLLKCRLKACTDGWKMTIVANFALEIC